MNTALNIACVPHTYIEGFDGVRHGAGVGPAQEVDGFRTDLADIHATLDSCSRFDCSEWAIATK
jgi:hypothetical protein